jgi:hypothetical protein
VAIGTRGDARNLDQALDRLTDYAKLSISA